MEGEITSVMESGSDSGHVFMALFLQGRGRKEGRGALNHQPFSIVLLEAACAPYTLLYSCQNHYQSVMPLLTSHCLEGRSTT